LRKSGATDASHLAKRTPKRGGILLDIVSVDVYELQLKLRRPYKISLKTISYAENLLVAIRTTAGSVGYGEAAPIEAITGDTKEDALAFLRKASQELKGKNPSDISEIHRLLDRISIDTKTNSQTARNAIDAACYDVIGKFEKKPVYQLLGESTPRVVPASIGLGIESAEDLVTQTKEYLEMYKGNGPWSLKLKMDGNPKMDLSRVLAVAEIFPRGIKLDPNQAYTDPKVAVKTFNTLYDKIGSKVMLIEEPCPKGDLDKLKYVSENSKIPIYADETAATLDDVKKIIKLKAASGVNLKLPKIGGIYWASQAAKLLKDAGLRLQVGIMIESRIGLAAAANFAAGTTNVLDTDMDSDLYFETDITTKDSLPFVNGARVPSGRPGLGVLLKEEFNRVLEGDVSIQKLSV
jgi:L-alanine-DL-glutamate epimerase-like enolase superfamily enzyme